MQGFLKAYGYYFCSEACIREYERKIKRKWYKEKIFIVPLTISFILLISYLFKLSQLVYAFLDYLKMIWWAICLGLLIGGLIDHFVPKEYISKYLAQPKKETILYATGLGFLASACSHGILAISMELYKKGASVPAVITFLLAAPWANFAVTLMLFSFFRTNAFLLIISAIGVALITGLTYQLLDKKGLIESSKKVKIKEISIWKDVKRRIKSYHLNWTSVKLDLLSILGGAWALAKMVLWWILIGILIASFARTFVPLQIFQKYLGPTLLGLAVTLGIATLLEICSEGSSPLAFEIFRQTGAFGNSLVFLMAGVATDYTEIGLIWSNIGKKSALWLPVITIPQIFILGYLFNILL
jgi:hypothetical protein